MSIVSAIVLYIVIWFVVLFVTLPIGLRTQGDEGEVVQGTPESAPANFRMKRTVVIVSLVTLVIWAITSGIILSGWISVSDFDYFGPDR